MWKILILEDSDERIKLFKENLPDYDLSFTKSARECIDLLNMQTPGNYYAAIFLDHDLGDQMMVASGPGTGYEVAKWLESHKHKAPPRLIVHSFNPVGACNMLAALEGSHWHPGCWFKKAELEMLLK